MGKLNNLEPQIHHFSHPHLLELCNLQNQTQSPCSGCKLQLSGYVYTCRPCNFTLHVSCTQFAQLITHPSHTAHHLSLLPAPTYPGGQFNCDACNRRGDGFSYHCSRCDYDLHVVCASKPLSVTHHFHPDHPLQLTFRPPYEVTGFSCDVCRKIGAKQWLYRCVGCEFDVHLDCATAQPTPPPAQPPRPLQHHHSFPGVVATPTLLAQRQLPLPQQHHHSFPVAQPQPLVPLQHHHSFPAAAPPVAQPNYYAHSASTGAMQSYQQPGSGNGSGGGLINSLIQGFVEGAAQQVGQNLMQSMIGGGGGGDGGGGDGYTDGSGDSSSGLF